MAATVAANCCAVFSCLCRGGGGTRSRGRPRPRRAGRRSRRRSMAVGQLSDQAGDRQVGQPPSGAGLSALLDRGGGDDQRGDRVGRAPPEQAVQQEAHEQHRRQVGAEQGLLRVRDRRAGAELVAGAPLGIGQAGHDRQGDRGQGDAGGGVLGLGALEQRPCRRDGDVGREGEERERDDSQGGLLPGLRSRPARKLSGGVSWKRSAGRPILAAGVRPWKS